MLRAPLHRPLPDTAEPCPAVFALNGIESEFGKCPDLISQLLDATHLVVLGFQKRVCVILS